MMQSSTKISYWSQLMT